jgi:hypothetical protein
MLLPCLLRSCSQRRPDIEGNLAQWTVWALRLGATEHERTAPDGSLWFVRIVYE